MTDRQPIEDNPLEVAATEIRFAEQARMHYWVTRLDFRTDLATLDYLSADDDQPAETSFDVADLVRPPSVACVICDEPFSPQVRSRKCLGRRRVGGFPMRPSS